MRTALVAPLMFLLLLSLLPVAVLGQGAGGGGGGGGSHHRSSRGSGGSCGTGCGVAIGCIVGGAVLAILAVLGFAAHRKARRRAEMISFVKAPATTLADKQHPEIITHNTAESMPAAGALSEGRWHVEGTYTGAPGSRVNDGTHQTSFDAELRADPEGTLLMTGKGSDVWGDFNVDGAVGQGGGPVRAAFLKHYNKVRRGADLRYTGSLSGGVFSGEWQVFDDPEHGTFELRFTPEGQPAAAPTGAAQPEGMPKENGVNGATAPMPALSAPVLEQRNGQPAAVSVAEGSVPGGPGSDDRV